MSLNDILTLVISGLALVFSLVSFVYTVLMGPRLRILIGEKISLSHARPALHHALNVNASFTFFNEGATPGVIFELSGTISSGSGGKAGDLIWRAFLESRNMAQPGEMVRYRNINLGEPGPIIVTGRAVGGVETKLISMQTTEQFELSQGDYKLVFRGLTGPKRGMRCKETVILKITEQDAALLLSKEYSADPVTGEIPHSLTLTRQKPSGRNVTSRFLRSAPVFVSQLVPISNGSPSAEDRTRELQQGSSHITQA